MPIEYESTNTEVATVDKNTGVVTLVGGGETTIKAVFPGNENYETALASYILTVSNATMEVSATGYEGVYDGNAHGITVTAPEGATVKYGTEEGKYDLTENPTYTNVGTYTVYYQVTKEGKCKGNHQQGYCHAEVLSRDGYDHSGQYYVPGSDTDSYTWGIVYQV